MEKRFYEVLIALEPSIGAADGDGLLGRLQAAVVEAKGEVRSMEKLGIRRLAFRVKGRTDAHFVLMTCHMPMTAVPVVEQVLRMNENVIRYMTTRLDQSLVMPLPGEAPAPAPVPTPAPAPVAPPAPAA
jgi:small subunit ribosomal protein S6